MAIKDVFKKCSSENRVAFIAYITAGDPDYKTSLKIVDALAAAKIDMLELGVPFSDPLADGEANQLAAERALKSGMTAEKVLDEAREIREKYPELPLVLFTYLNPVAYLKQPGKASEFSEFCRRAVSSGIDAILPLDLPPEESCEYRAAIDDAGLPVVSLVAPTSSESRIRLLAENANAFVYYVSKEGVTGEGKYFSSAFSERIAMIKKYTNLPVVVGFGVSTPEHVKAAVSTGVDGVVVGSAIVRKVEALAKGSGTLADIKNFVTDLISAVSHGHIP